MRTLNELIAESIGVAETEEDEVVQSVEPLRAASSSTPTPMLKEASDVAAALEFLASDGGIKRFFHEKVAYMPPNNLKAAQPPPVKVPSGPSVGHPALASNAAAMAFDKREHSKAVAPTLSAVLDATPFADPVLRDSLSPAATKVDPNIHATQRKTAEAVAIRAELARRVRGA